jgi:hypothetical protein
MNNTKYYGLPEWEILSSDKDEALERIFEDHREKVGEGDEAVAERIEWPIILHVYELMKLPKAESIADKVLDNLYDDLNGEFSIPEGNYEDPSALVKRAALSLAAAIRLTFKTWQCEPTGEKITITKEEALNS